MKFCMVNKFITIVKRFCLHTSPRNIIVIAVIARKTTIKLKWRKRKRATESLSAERRGGKKFFFSFPQPFNIILKNSFNLVIIH